MDLRGIVQLDIRYDGVFRTVEQALTATTKLAPPAGLADVTRQFLNDLQKSSRRI
jgi:hypothetical protein